MRIKLNSKIWIAEYFDGTIKLFRSFKQIIRDDKKIKAYYKAFIEGTIR